METTSNYSGFTDMFLDSDDDFEPYGCSETSDSLKRIYDEIESYRAGFEDREYIYDQ